MINWGAIPAGTVIPFPFAAYGASGESLTISGLATTDIEVYKGTSVTQRSSDNGYALIDTDGIDIDSTTGIHGFSIDTSDNTDSGFYSVGSLFYVVVNAITINSQTVRFIAGTFRLVAAEHTAGYPVATIKDGTGTGEIDTTSGGVLVAALANNAITANSINADAITAAKVASDVGTEIGTAVWATATRTLTALDEDSTTIDIDNSVWGGGTRTLTALDEDSTTLDLDATIRAAVGLAAANLDTQIGDLPTNAELATALGTADDAVLAAIAALNNLSAAEVNAEVDTALADYDAPTKAELDAAVAPLALEASLTTVDGNVDAIKAKTDDLTFTVAGQVDANIQYVNDTEVTGDGETGTEWGPA